MTLRLLLSNVLYKGAVPHKGATSGEHEGIVDEELWEKVNMQLALRSTGQRGKVHGPQGVPLKEPWVLSQNVVFAIACQLREPEKAWATACDAAGISGALFHDPRRTGVTNMIKAGLSEKETMEISGRKTRTVFDRYHILSERQMKQNAEKLEAHLESRNPSRR